MVLHSSIQRQYHRAAGGTCQKCRVYLKTCATWGVVENGAGDAGSVTYEKAPHSSEINSALQLPNADEQILLQAGIIIDQ